MGVEGRECGDGLWTKVNVLKAKRHSMGGPRTEDAPGGQGARTLCSQCKGPRFDPWLRNWTVLQLRPSEAK